MRYSPSPLVRTVRERLVSVFVTDTSALATAAPVVSITWPYIVVEVICSLTPTEEVMTSKQKSITTPSFLRIGFSYRCAGHLCASSYFVHSQWVRQPRLGQVTVPHCETTSHCQIGPKKNPAFTGILNCNFSADCFAN